MTIAETARFFGRTERMILSSHESPDADGLGAEYALTKCLRALGKSVRAVNAGPAPAKYAFIDEEGLIESMDEAALDEEELRSSVAVLVDTNDIQYTGALADAVLDKAASIFIFDHHESKGLRLGSACSIPEASSTCEMAFLLIKELGCPLSPDVASALFAGIVYDTGSFAYAKTSAQTFSAALELVRAGARPSWIHGQLYESSNTGVLLLRKAVLSTLELYDDDAIAVQILTKDMLDDCGAAYEDAEELINVPLQGKSVQVSIFFKSNASGVLRCSLRSKGSVNVAHIAQGFGGGGHKTAAGFKCPHPLDTMRARVLERVRQALTERR
jgi:phosphoesterase RecJ-like protein